VIVGISLNWAAVNLQAFERQILKDKKTSIELLPALLSPEIFYAPSKKRSLLFGPQGKYYHPLDGEFGLFILETIKTLEKEDREKGVFKDSDGISHLFEIGDDEVTVAPVGWRNKK